jgi:nucleotide-binding universal stress UspA family protein
MYTKMIVCVDGGETSNRALCEAVKLAKEQHAQLRLVHVCEDLPPYLVTEMPLPTCDYERLMREAGEKLLAKSAESASAAGLVVDTQYAEIDSSARRACDVINREADAWPADLIVTGTHGRRGFNRLLLGSVAEGALRTASKPVLIIRGQ